MRWNPYVGQACHIQVEHSFMLLLLLVMPIAISHGAEEAADNSPTAAFPGKGIDLTPLDRRRLRLLEIADEAIKLGEEDSQSPKPSLTLARRNEHAQYQQKVLAILGLVDVGAAPESRIEEANRLLRYALHKWPANRPSDLRGQYAKVWNHNARSQAMRIYLLYSKRLDADIHQEYLKRIRWLVSPPLRRSSENIRFTSNSAYFLAHEIVGATDEPSYLETKEWLIERMRSIGKDGPHEWGRNYLSWTMGAILNLADFAQDKEVRLLATMVIDHYLAELSGFVIDGNYGSGAVRMWKWTFSTVLPQTSIVRILFPECYGIEEERLQLNWVVSKYGPLRIVAKLFESESPHEAFLTTGPERWRHHVYRGDRYLIAAHQAIEKGKFDLRTGGTHGVMGVFVQSAKGPRNCVFPFGCLPMMPPKKQRNLTERYFGYRNVGFAECGGVVRAVWAGGGRFPGVHVRLFYAFDFKRIIENGWAFLTDGEIYVAWRPSQGSPVDDPQSEKLTANPTWGGKWLKSTHIPGPEGEVSVIEVGDAQSFGSYRDFRNDIQARNPNPKWRHGKLTYKTKDGAVIEYGTDYVKVNGKRVSVEDYPRAKMPGLRNYTVTHAGAHTTFDFDAITIRGDTRRVPANLVFGAAPAEE